MVKSTKKRAQKRHKALRMAGLRPVQIWIPDTRQPGFAAKCRRQSKLAAKADLSDMALSHLMDSLLADDIQ